MDAILVNRFYLRGIEQIDTADRRAATAASCPARAAAAATSEHVSERTALASVARPRSALDAGGSGAGGGLGAGEQPERGLGLARTVAGVPERGDRRGRRSPR